MRRSAAVLAAILLALAACRSGDAGPGDHPGQTSLPGDANDGTAAVVETATESTDERPPAPVQRYNVREGRALYMHYCATCHGDEGHGDGLNAYNLDPKPRDLASPDFQSQRSDDDIIAVIRTGGGVAGLSTAMPPWGRTIEERRVRQIVEYLRTLNEPAE